MAILEHAIEDSNLTEDIVERIQPSGRIRRHLANPTKRLRDCRSRPTDVPDNCALVRQNPDETAHEVTNEHLVRCERDPSRIAETRRWRARPSLTEVAGSGSPMPCFGFTQSGGILETELGRHPPMRGWIVAPLIGTDGENYGFILASDRIEGDFTDQDETDLVRLANLTAAALDALAQLHLADYRAKVAERDAE